MEDIKIGSEVILASGGRTMTVTHISDGYATCEWHDDHGTPQKQNYPLVTIELDEDPEDGDFWPTHDA